MDRGKDHASRLEYWPTVEVIDDVVDVGPCRYVVLAAKALLRVRSAVALLQDDVVWLVGRVSYLDGKASGRPNHISQFYSGLVSLRGRLYG